MTSLQTSLQTSRATSLLLLSPALLLQFLGEFLGCGHGSVAIRVIFLRECFKVDVFLGADLFAVGYECFVAAGAL